METFLTPFVKEKYHADRNIRKHYNHQMATFISKKYDKPIKEVYDLISKIFVPNKNGFKDANIKALIKNEYGDREYLSVTSSEYFKRVDDNNYHITGSLVAYKNTDDEECINSIATKKFIALRKEYKNLKKEAQIAEDPFLTEVYNEVQNALKIFNNAQSGAMSSKGTPISNKSGHTALTSTCRCLTSVANVTNEKFISGNRYLSTPEKTMENLLSIITTSDMKAIDRTIKEYNLNYATVEQVMQMIKKNSYCYWDNPEKMSWLEDFVKLLKPVELTAILCYADLVGLYACNPEFTIKFLKDWAVIPDDDRKGIKPDNSDRRVLCLSKLPDKRPKDEDIDRLNAYHLELEKKYYNFITAFLRPKTVPGNVHEVTYMVRETVQTSDTDSSIYSVDRLLDDLGITNEDEVLQLNGALTYFIRAMSINQHAQLSKTMNIGDDGLYALNMKNEYFFPAYVTTFMTKHYFTYKAMQEGIKLFPYEDEIKGVHLRGIKIPKPVRDYSSDLMRRILNAVENKQKLNASEELFKVAELERTIIRETLEGNPKWLVAANIKSGEVYAKPEQSIYKYHVMWNDVFMDKYPCTLVLPYRAYKIPTWTDSKSRYAEYIELLRKEIGDEDIIKRFNKFMETQTDLTTIYVPLEALVRSKTIPKEILLAMDIRKVITQNLKSIYEILKACGIHIANDKYSKLISDEH